MYPGPSTALSPSPIISSIQSYEVGTVIIPILQIGKMKQSSLHFHFKYLAQGHKPVGQDWNQSRRSACRVSAPNIQVLKSVNNLPLTATYQEMVNVQLPP